MYLEKTEKFYGYLGGVYSFSKLISYTAMYGLLFYFYYLLCVNFFPLWNMKI